MDDEETNILNEYHNEDISGYSKSQTCVLLEGKLYDKMVKVYLEEEEAKRDIPSK